MTLRCRCCCYRTEFDTSLICHHHRVTPLVRIRSQNDHHDPDSSLFEGSIRTGRWARLSAGREVNLLSSHAGRSGAPDGRQKHSTSHTNCGHRYAEPTRRASPKHDTEPLCAAIQWAERSIEPNTGRLRSIMLVVPVSEMRKWPGDEQVVPGSTRTFCLASAWANSMSSGLGLRTHR